MFKKSQINQVLKNAGYGQRADFAEIAKYAVSIVPGSSFHAEALLKQVDEKFGSVLPKTGLLDAPRPYDLFLAPGMPVDQGALDQLKLAMRLPPAVAAVGMPDLHQGYCLPIGGVAVLDHAVSPAFVGYDIGCRMSLTIWNSVDPETLENESVRKTFLEAVLDSTSFGLGSRAYADDVTGVMDHPYWNMISSVKQRRELAWQQLGSSGAGNHFCEVVSGETLVDSQLLGKAGSKWVGLMTHSGSRGIGNKLGHYYATVADQETAKKYRIPKGYGWLDTHSELGAEYLMVLQLMDAYASANHAIIHQAFSRHTGLRPLLHLENAHNMAWVNADGTVIHRKGATPADDKAIGIIPGSSGTPSYVVEGLGNPAALFSSSHGAGRPYSRTKAKELYQEEDGAQRFADHMRQAGITHYGVAADETFMAYKDIEAVIKVQEDSKILRRLAKMTPKVVVMGALTDDRSDGD